MATKPTVCLPNVIKHLAEVFFDDKLIFKEVETNSSFIQLRYDGKFHSILSIIILTKEQFDECDINELITVSSTDSYLQSYIIFSNEYDGVKCDKLSEFYKIKSPFIVFTDNFINAVKYGLGIMEKGPKYGILDMR